MKNLQVFSNRIVLYLGNVLIELPEYTNDIFEHLLQNKFKAYKWKLIYFILPFGKPLHTWNIFSSDKCNYCNETDDYDHLFFKCKLSVKFWISFYVIVLVLIPPPPPPMLHPSQQYGSYQHGFYGQYQITGFANLTETWYFT